MVTVRIDQHSRPGPRPVRVEGEVVGCNLMMSDGSETIGEIDDLVTVREIQDQDVLHRRCRHERHAWRDELGGERFVSVQHIERQDWVYQLLLRSEADLDDDLHGWLKEAYEVGQQQT
jgi:hypothetical protein